MIDESDQEMPFLTISCKRISYNAVAWMNRWCNKNPLDPASGRGMHQDTGSLILYPDMLSGHLPPFWPQTVLLSVKKGNNAVIPRYFVQ